MEKIKVLVVDDSALVRDLLTGVLESDPGIEVVGTAMDPLIARQKIKSLNPDVLTLDIEMPRMDGLTFLLNLMRLRPMPVVMISTLTEKGADVTLRALEIGAIDFVAKPRSDLAEGIEGYREVIIEKVKAAAGARVRPYLGENPPGAEPGEIEPKHSADAVLRRRKRRARFTSELPPLIAIGASTGGTEAIREVLEQLPPDLPPVVIAQHIPEAFSLPFARRMDAASPLKVLQARDGEPLREGHVYIAPGSHHLIIERRGTGYRCELSNGPRVNRHRPSVDVLFRSVADAAGPRGIGVILTGMGDDGARGMVEMQQAGAQTLAQDENSSVVWGMPGAAVRQGAVGKVLPLGRVAAEIERLVEKVARGEITTG